MRYFIMRQDMRVTDRPQPRDFFQKIDVRNIKASRAGLVPPRTLVTTRPFERLVFPDVLFAPVLLVTREAKDVIKAFEGHLAFCQVVFLSSKPELVQLYYMPMLDEIDCLSERCEYANESRGAFAKVVLKRAPVRDKSLFLVKNSIQRLTAIRLDLAESLLSRDLAGFVLDVADMEEE